MCPTCLVTVVLIHLLGGEVIHADEGCAAHQQHRALPQQDALR